MSETYQYEIVLPSNGVKENKKYPVLFALHGIGYNENEMLSVFEGLKEDFILIGIRGNLTYEEGFAYYYLQEYGKPGRKLFDESMEGLQDFIETSLDKYPIDPNHIYLAGFSQGAVLANSLALVVGDKISGIVSMNGYVPDFVAREYQVKSIDQLSVFLTDGEKDNIFPPEIGEKNYQFFKEKGASVKYKTYPTGHLIGNENKNDVTDWLLARVHSINKQ
ncbi:alpha/beta hydrolase [Oceanobacillus rekensis]|uniref:alpha/beta hydrolase n=1 Tax=Oceanobacillus rekensis TaxID=937927 RepID=UPI001FE63DCE|nr:alpha/beta hydrolase-fold protein [Oceanobacillus rekensis]